jgi:pentatricopeptide repeat protein
MFFEESLKVFEALPVKDVVAWNALISVYVNQRRGQEAIQCFEQMQSVNEVPDSITFAFILKACTMTGAMEKAQEVCAQVINSGLESEVTVRTSLVDMYCAFGNFHEAEELLSKFRARNTIVCLNALITGYEMQGHHKKAVMCFKKIVFDSMVPDEVTFTASLRACGSLGCITEGRRTHSLIVMRGLEEDLVVGSTVVSMYTKCGSPDEGRAVFRSLSLRNVVSWTSLMAGHAQLMGEQEQVFDAFGSMIREGVDPDLVSILGLLTVCDHVGLVEKGCAYFGTICNASMLPLLEHFTCVVDSLGRAGLIDEVLALIQNMPFHPSIASWHTLLGACQSVCDSKLGEYAFENAVMLDDSDCTAYVSLYNVYAKCKDM